MSMFLQTGRLLNRTALKTGVVLILGMTSLVQAAQVEIIEPRIRAMPPVASSSAAYLLLKNTDDKSVELVDADVLTADGKSVADKVEIHTTRMEDGVMKMERLSGITIEPGRTIKLAPGGNHIMMMGLNRSLNAGNEMTLRLVFSDGDKVEVKAPVTKVLKENKIMKMAMDHSQMVMITEPRVRAMPPGSATTAAYLTVKNNGKENLEIVKASSPIADKVSLHESVKENGVMKMVSLPQVLLPAGRKVRFKPGGKHIMMVGLKKSLVTGDKVLIELELSNGEILKVKAPVKKLVSEKGNLPD